MKKDYTISAHCEQRYAERIMGKSDKNEINTFIANNKNKIHDDIMKMLEYGEVIYDNLPGSKANSILSVYIMGTWILLVNERNNVAVTIYRADLGLGEDFNKEYVDRYVEKIATMKSELKLAEDKCNADTKMYTDLLTDTEEQIKEYKTMVKNLEDLADGYRVLLKNNNVVVKKKRNEITNLVKRLTGSHK